MINYHFSRFSNHKSSNHQLWHFASLRIASLRAAARPRLDQRLGQPLGAAVGTLLQHLLQLHGGGRRLRMGIGEENPWENVEKPWKICEKDGGIMENHWKSMENQWHFSNFQGTWDLFKSFDH